MKYAEIVTVTHHLRGVKGDVYFQKHAPHSRGWLKGMQDTHIYKHTASHRMPAAVFPGQ